MTTTFKPKLLNTTETAELLYIRPNTLNGWRIKGVGPRFLKIGRLIRYSENDVNAWLDTQTHTNTSQYSTHLDGGQQTISLVTAQGEIS